MGLSIKDVARQCRVSTATVSRVVNRSPLVQSATRARVLKAIERVGYKPNLAARSLILGRSNLVSLVVPPDPGFFSSFYFRQVLYGINRALSRLHYRMMIIQPEGYSPETGYAAQLDDFEADGLLILAPLIGDKLVKHLEERQFPSVLLNARSRKLDWVDMDNTSAASRVTDELIGLGHRRIAYIAGARKGANACARLEGYKLALKKHGIAFDPGLVFHGNYCFEHGFESARKLLDLVEKPTAVFANNDVIAVGAIHAFVQAGFNVPGDVSIFGCDNEESAWLSNPPLSTVRQPFLEMGEAAGRLLVERVENPGAPHRHEEFSGDIIFRGSCSVPLGSEKPAQALQGGHAC